jgi:hypothetical protein
MVTPRTGPDAGEMITLHIEHAVTDFDIWSAAFTRFDQARKQAGVRRHVVRRPVDDPHHVSIDLEFAEVDEAVAFERFLRETVWATPTHSPALRGSPVTSVLREEVVGA